MYRLFFIFSALLFSQFSNANELESQIYCDNSFNNKIVLVNSDYDIDNCVADVVWGSSNVCYVGSAVDLVNKINDGETYFWKVGLEMKNAKISQDGTTVEYTGIDRLVMKKDITPCDESFFN